jgi:gliding motility-associated protein GldM
LNVNAGRPGDHVIEGNLIFRDAGVESKIPVSQSFAVISKPNAAVISADKMNVVYRGVDNPMTISIPGIPDDKINARAAGLRRVKGSKFNMNPGKGREVSITATGKLPDGQAISTKTKFRIKDLPKPSATFFRQPGRIRLPKSSIERAEVGAVLEDFDFDLTLKTLEFKVKIPGSPTITCKGTRLSPQALQALGRVRTGQEISIFDLKVQNPAKPSYKFKRVAPVLIEIL